MTSWIAPQAEEQGAPSPDGESYSGKASPLGSIGDHVFHIPLLFSTASPFHH